MSSSPAEHESERWRYTALRLDRLLQYHTVKLKIRSGHEADHIKVGSKVRSKSS